MENSINREAMKAARRVERRMRWEQDTAIRLVSLAKTIHKEMDRQTEGHEPGSVEGSLTAAAIIITATENSPL
jgi:hypothetical protein